MTSSCSSGGAAPLTATTCTTDEGLLAAIRDANPAADLFLNTPRRRRPLSPDRAQRVLSVSLGAVGGWRAGMATRRRLGRLRRTSVTIPDGAQVCLGFDGSFNNDSTALVVVSCGDVPHIDVVAAWEKDPLDGPDWTVPILDVEDAIRNACRAWQVRESVCDPFRWARTYQVLEAENLPVVEFPQSPSRMTPASAAFFQAVMNHGPDAHSADPRLARHVGTLCDQDRQPRIARHQGEPAQQPQDRPRDGRRDGLRPGQRDTADLQHS